MSLNTIQSMDELRQDLLIEGAFSKASEIATFLGMRDWLAKEGLLAIEYSPYLPSTFFDEFGDREPSKEELRLANLKNFSNSLSLLSEEILENGDLHYGKKVKDICICIEEEQKNMEQIVEATKEEDCVIR